MRTHESLRTVHMAVHIFECQPGKVWADEDHARAGARLVQGTQHQRRTYRGNGGRGHPGLPARSASVPAVHTPRLECAHTTSGFRHKRAHATHRRRWRRHAWAGARTGSTKMTKGSLRSASQQLHPCTPAGTSPNLTPCACMGQRRQRVHLQRGGSEALECASEGPIKRRAERASRAWPGRSRRRAPHHAVRPERQASSNRSRVRKPRGIHTSNTSPNRTTYHRFPWIRKEFLKGRKPNFE